MCGNKLPAGPSVTYQHIDQRQFRSHSESGTLGASL